MPNGKQKVLKCTITKKDFIDWYYFDGSDQENEKLISELGMLSLSKFISNLKIELKDIFKNCNHSIIPGKYIQEYKKSLEFKNEELDFIEYKLGVKIKLKLI